MICRSAIVLSILILSAFQAFSQSREADIFSQLINICVQAKTNNINSTAGIADVLKGVLDTISGAYTSHDYYSSGAWGEPQRYYPSAIQPPVSGVKYICTKGQSITSQFGYRDQFNRMHFGIDIAMCTGDTVRCSMPGTVSSTGYDRGYGNYIFIVHDNGLETRYGHLSRQLVVSGQRILQGDAIALSGNTGHSTGPHLHLETRYRGIPIDPRMVFNFILENED